MNEDETNALSPFFLGGADRHITLMPDVAITPIGDPCRFWHVDEHLGRIPAWDVRELELQRDGTAIRVLRAQAGPRRGGATTVKLIYPVPSGWREIGGDALEMLAQEGPWTNHYGPAAF